LETAARTVYLKVVNNNADPRPVTIALDGAAGLSDVAAEAVLTSGDRSDQNTFAAPSAVTPVLTMFSDVSPSFSHTFPGNSVTVLTLTGVTTAPTPRSAFARIEAESYDTASSLAVEPCSENGLDIASTVPGSSATYESVDFGVGAIAMRARAMSDGGSAIEIRLDSAEGKLAGTCLVPKTAGWTTSSCAVSGVNGVHDVYLMFTDSLRLNWVQFLAAPVFTAANVTNGASFRRGIVPGSIATLFGAGLSSVKGIARAALPLPRQLAGTTVTVNGIAAPLFALANVNGAEQINLQVPFEIA